MKHGLHIVAQCTDRKKASVPAQLRLRACRQSTLPERVEAWVDAVQTHEAKLRARDLYAGEHWATMLDLDQSLATMGIEASLWVASAGLGFVDANTKVSPYSATFASGVADSVVSGHVDLARQRREWWEALHRAWGQRKLLALARKEPRATFVVVVSPAYLDAMSTELELVAHALEDPDQLAIVSGECSVVTNGPLERNWVPSLANLQSIVGGSRIGQHARVARELVVTLASDELGAAVMRKRAEAWLRRAPPLETFDRTIRSDAQVRTYIRKSKANSWSRALRELRAAGFACEQKRFRKLFYEVWDS